MHQELLGRVIFSPGELALGLAEGLQKLGADVTLFSPGPVETTVKNVSTDLTYFQEELARRGDTYLSLLKKHPVTFISLARQVQAELLAKAYAMANTGEFDIIHIYTNEEDLALPFAALCNRPVIFTHHDPFNFLIKYKAVFPKYAQYNWLSMSMAQRKAMPPDTKWVANIYHGLDPQRFRAHITGSKKYLAYMGRIIQPKGVHLAIQAVRQYNRAHPQRPYVLKIAGQHYTGVKDAYWQHSVHPLIDNTEIQYAGYIKSDAEKQEFLGNAAGLIIPSTFSEPFGMVMIEALACGTPIVGLNSGAIPEVARPGKTGFVAGKVEAEDGKLDDAATSAKLAQAIAKIHTIDRAACRQDFEERFTLQRMCQEHLAAYQRLLRAGY